jgi:hypothetical protein
VTAVEQVLAQVPHHVTGGGRKLGCAVKPVARKDEGHRGGGLDAL